MTRAVVAVLGTVLYVATVITATAFEALLLDADPIAQRDAGPLLGPGMVVTAGTVVLLVLLRAASLADAAEGRTPEVHGTFPAQPASPERPRRPTDGLPADDRAPASGGPGQGVVVPAVVAALLAGAGMLAVGSVFYGIGRGELVWVLLFAGEYAVSPFVLGASLLAGLVVAGTLAVTRAEARRAGPR